MQRILRRSVVYALGKHGAGERNTGKIINAVKIKPAGYKKFEGKYTSNEGDNFTIICKGDSLIAKNELDGFTTRLLPVSSTEFASYNLPFNFKFTKNDKGDVTGFSYRMFDDIMCAKVK